MSLSLSPSKNPLSLLATLVLLLAPFLATSQGASAQLIGDLGLLQGEWRGSAPGGGESVVTIAGSSLRYQTRPDFWYETTFTLPDETDPPQLHATIVRDSSGEETQIGRVVVAIYEVGDERLRLGVVDDFDEPPEEPVEGDWEWAFDQWELERVRAN